MSAPQIGPLMIDVEGLSLTQKERELLAYRSVGGVILFSRNFESVDQLLTLVNEIRAVNSELLISVDHEGGRVQRFKKGFTRIPPMALLGKLYESNQELGLQTARDTGWLFASELLSLGIDFSFAPVLDQDHGVSDVIGDRAFSDNPIIIVEVASALIAGMNDAGMAATGKHFPGHGAVTADSHVDLPIDDRTQKEIFEQDMSIFSAVASKALQAVMPAHVVYTHVDAKPAGFSPVWLQDILRHQLNFEGVIFSDDLAMAGAEFAGNFTERADAALKAGCDMILVCNDPDSAKLVADYLENKQDLVFSTRLNTMKGNFSSSPLYASLQSNPRWLATRERLSSLI